MLSYTSPYAAIMNLNVARLAYVNSISVRARTRCCYLEARYGYTIAAGYSYMVSWAVDVCQSTEDKLIAVIKCQCLDTQGKWKLYQCLK